MNKAETINKITELLNSQGYLHPFIENVLIKVWEEAQKEVLFEVILNKDSGLKTLNSYIDKKIKELTKR